MKKKEMQPYIDFILKMDYQKAKEGALHSKMNARDLYAKAKIIQEHSKNEFASYNYLFISIEEFCKAYYLNGITIFKKMNRPIPNEIIEEFVGVYFHHKKKLAAALNTIMTMIDKTVFQGGKYLNPLPEAEQKFHREQMRKKYSKIYIEQCYLLKNRSLYVDIDLTTGKFTLPLFAVDRNQYIDLVNLASQMSFIVDSILVSDEEEALKVFYEHWMK